MGKGNSAQTAPSKATEVAPAVEPTPEPSHEATMFASSQIGCDPRLARRVLKYGPQICRNVAQRERAIAFFAVLAASEAAKR